VRTKRGKIRTSERNRYESFYLPGEQYTAVAVEPVPARARQQVVAVEGKEF
jgi:hypothetical protein